MCTNLFPEIVYEEFEAYKFMEAFNLSVWNICIKIKITKTRRNNEQLFNVSLKILFKL